MPRLPPAQPLDSHTQITYHAGDVLVTDTLGVAIMKRLAITLVFTLAVLLGLGTGLYGQQPSIRNPQIDTETPEGQLIAQAGTSEDPAEKVKYLRKQLLWAILASITFLIARSTEVKVIKDGELSSPPMRL